MMAPKVNNEGTYKIGDINCDKRKVYWTISSKKMFIDLELEYKQKGNV